MKQIPSYLSVAVAILGFGFSQLGAQTAPAPSAAATDETSTVKLDPFNVNASSDVGFVAANSLAGGRMTMALKDTPVAYSVLTSEFLEAFNITDAGKASEFSVNTNQYVGDGLQGTSGNTTVVVRIRGQSANQPTRNFFPYNIASDTYNVDRLDFARGANSTLFGAGAAAGTLNTVTKTALTTRPIREVRAQVGSWDRYRMTLDVNQPLSEKAAVRANLLWQSNNTWRQREWERRRGISLAGTYHFSPKFSLRAEAEYRITDKTTGTNRTKDQTSAWDGKFTPSGPNPAMTAAQMAVAGVTRSQRRFVIDGENRNVAYNIENRFQTKNAAYNATTPNYLDGQVIRTTGFTVNSSMTDVWNPPMRFGAVFKGSPHFVLPDKTFTPLWDRDYKYPSGWERGKDVNLFATYRPFEGLYVELSGDKNEVYRWTEYPAAGGMYDMRVDINRLNPDGTPNMFFLQPYSENSPFSFAQSYQYTNANLQTAYVKDTRFGKLQAGVMAGVQNLDNIKREDFFLLPLHQGIIPGADFRSFFPPQQDQNLQSVYTRQYTALRGTVPTPHVTQNPLTVYDYTRGTRAVMAPKWYTLPNRLGWGVDTYKRYKYVQAVANVSLLKNHLVLIGAARRDFTRQSTLSHKQSDDMPPDWDGTYMTPKASPPADYWTLTYTPKDATGKVIAGATPIPAPQRPRSAINGVNVPLAQYANDRFQDDYSTPDLTTAVNTRSFGAVVNLWKGIGLYANDSTTYDTPAGTLNVNMNLIPPTSSRSYDAGVRYTMPNGKLNFSFGWFKAFQRGASQSVGTSFFANNNTIADSPVIGDLSEGGRNQRGHPRFNGFSINSTITNETIGYESELTANLTPNWRLIVNWGRNTPMQKDVWPDVVPWIEAHEAVYRQILEDSGIQIRAGDNQASIKPEYNDPTKINVTRVTNTVNAWNSLMGPTGALATLRLTAATKNRQILNGSAGGPLYTYNVATDYRFQKGFVRGLRAGIAVNYRARSILGAKTNETIADPNNPNRSIASPTNDANNYLYGKAYYKGAANFSYTWRLKEGGKYTPKTIQFDLAIDNLFNLDQVLEYSTTSNSTANSNILVPVNNDISQQALILVPGAYNWQPPRSYQLTAKINF